MGSERIAAAGAAVLMWSALAGLASAQCVTAPEPASATMPALESGAGPTARDFGGRVVAPVFVNGQGPYRFIVDTGANRSVLSSAVAEQLGLTPSSIGEVHSIASVALAPLVNVDSITFQGMRLESAALPVIDGGALSEHGVLGVDGLRGHRLRIDFERGCMEIMRGSRPAPESWWSVQGELRLGNLLLAHATIEGVPVNILVDSGSDVTLANHALRTAIGRARQRRATAFLATSVSSGSQRFTDFALTLPDVHMGEVTIRNLSAYPADFHIFDLWGLQDEPTLLIGMDALSQVGAMEIDYADARIFFRRDRVESVRPRVHGD